jgi:hypothetical protein
MPTNRKLLKYNETSDTAAAEGKNLTNLAFLARAVIDRFVAFTTPTAEANKLFVFWENAHLVRHSLMAVAWTSFVACIALHMH